MKKIILSDHKLNLLVDEVTAKLRADHPLESGHISGAEIVDFCPHKQVSQFVLFRIYQDASSYVAQLGHPSFDFGSPEVKEDLRRFLATLSRNIRLSVQDFETLLRQAVYNTLKLILNPEDSIANFFFGNSDAIPLELYRKHAPYFTDYDFVIRSILAWYEKNQLIRVDRDVFLEKFERVVELFEKREGQSLGEYQRMLFKSLTGMEMEAVVATVTSSMLRTESAAPAVELPKEEKKPESKPEEKKPEPPKEETHKKPLISIRPKEKEQPPQTEAPAEVKESKPTVPPWVEQTTVVPPAAKEEESKPVFSPNTAPPRSETPPWVEKKSEPKREEIILDPVTPLEEEEEEEIFAFEPIVETRVVETPKVEEPKLEAPAVPESQPQTPPVVQPERKTLVDSLEQKEEKRSINDRFNNRDEKRPTLLERMGQQEKSAEEKTPSTLLERLNQSQNPEPKTPAVSPEPPREEPPVVIETPKVQPVYQAPPPVEQPAVERDAEPTTLADRFKTQSPNSTLADSFSSKNIRTEQIPVHKQFQFVQKVFGGSSVKFKVILDKINKTQSLPEAEEVLEKYVFNDPNVNRQDKVAKEFEQLVRGRFE